MNYVDAQSIINNDFQLGQNYSEPVTGIQTLMAPQNK